ncbi:MAG TPA: DUF1801 domain-containing protein, partial [Flavisolibacter sp.]|nr:DUF1801 domain-containing protein [Flavisolibacter sp.]
IMEKTVKPGTPKSVDDYLQQLPAAVRSTLEKVRTAIKEAAPMAEEVISYQVPFYKYKGALVSFAAFKNHCSFFGVTKDLFKVFEKELAPFTISGTTIHFTPEHPLPSSFIKKYVQLRVKLNEERKSKD